MHTKIYWGSLLPETTQFLDPDIYVSSPGLTFSRVCWSYALFKPIAQSGGIKFDQEGVGENILQSDSIRDLTFIQTFPDTFKNTFLVPFQNNNFTYFVLASLKVCTCLSTSLDIYLNFIYTLCFNHVQLTVILKHLYSFLIFH